MKINLAVCGRFHYHNYVRFLSEQGILNRFYFSHRISTNCKTLGLERAQAINIWPKEYLLGLHNRLLRGRYELQMTPLYANLWQAGVLNKWKRADAFHFMLHGNALRLCRRAKREGSIIIAEAVNSHIEDMHAIVDGERENLGLKRRTEGLSRLHLNQLEELALSDFLIVPSVAVRDSFVKRGYDARKTAVLPFGVDTERFRPLEVDDPSRDNSVFRVLCVAQISPRKGQVHLLRAWKSLALPNSELVLIGALTHEMRDVVEGYRGSFRHIPYVPNDRLREHYGRASVFVLPSLEDGCSYVCAEALACGVPVITTSSNGACEIIEHGKDGFIIPPLSSEAIEEHLSLLYEDTRLRGQMSMAALEKARSKLGWQNYAHRMSHVYQGVLGLATECEVREHT
jgi:glycosyltransferase involved in cell wall biosynthesis